MSQENVEFLVDYLQRGTNGGVDAVAEFWDPDITWRAAEGAIDDVGEMHGPETVRRYVQDWFDMFNDLTVVAEELIDAGDVHGQGASPRSRRAAGVARVDRRYTCFWNSVTFGVQQCGSLRCAECEI